MSLFDDTSLQAAFVEENKSDFWDWCRDHKVSPRSKYHRAYCTTNSYQFLEFIDEYMEDIVLNEADKRNDLLKAHSS